MVSPSPADAPITNTSNGVPASLGTRWRSVVCTKSKAKVVTRLHTLKCHLLALPPAARRLTRSPNPPPVPGFKPLQTPSRALLLAFCF